MESDCMFYFSKDTRELEKGEYFRISPEICIEERAYKSFAEILNEISVLHQEHKYMLISTLYYYPISFRLKHFGLWKTESERDQFTFEVGTEAFENLSRHAWYQGACKLNIVDENILKSVKKDGRSKMLLFSKAELDLEKLLETSKQFRDGKGITDAQSLVNALCPNGICVLILEPIDSFFTLFRLQKD